MKSEGIVLKSQEFRDRQKIIQVFTLHLGVISLIVKGITRKAFPLLALTSPFVKAEFLFSESKSDLYRFVEGSILEAHLHLRTDFDTLETAHKMCQVILTSQMPLKPAAPLYALLSSYLGALSRYKKGENFLYSLYLKILRYEGLFSLEEFPESSAQTLSLSRSLEEIALVELDEPLKGEILMRFNILTK